MLKKLFFYLGLGSDEEYEQYDDRVTNASLGQRQDPAQTGHGAPYVQRSEPGSTTVRPIKSVGTPEPLPNRSTRSAQRHSAGNPHNPTTPQSTTGTAVRIVDDPPTRPTHADPHTISPTSFEQAAMIGEYLKSGQPLIINFQNAEHYDRRRLLDFASGGCYALGGNMKRVGDYVFLITQPKALPRNADHANVTDIRSNS